MKAAEWVKALRSGEYMQTKRRLSDGAGGHCCLGVLCEVKGLPKKTINDRFSETGLWVTYIFDHKEKVIDRRHFAPTPSPPDYFSANSIPRKFQSTILEDLDLSINVKNPLTGQVDRLSSILMEMNDRGASFNDIADYLETVQ